MGTTFSHFLLGDGTCWSNWPFAFAAMITVHQYAPLVSDQHLSKDSVILEKVQRRSALFTKAKYQFSPSVTHMHNELGWLNLQFKRLLHLTVIFKVVIGHVGIISKHIGFESAGSKKRMKHHHRFWTRKVTILASKFSFKTRIVQDWNCLPVGIV